MATNCSECSLVHRAWCDPNALPSHSAPIKERTSRAGRRKVLCQIRWKHLHHPVLTHIAVYPSGSVLNTGRAQWITAKKFLHAETEYLRETIKRETLAGASAEEVAADDSDATIDENDYAPVDSDDEPVAGDEVIARRLASTATKKHAITVTRTDGIVETFASILEASRAMHVSRRALINRLDAQNSGPPLRTAQDPYKNAVVVRPNPLPPPTRPPVIVMQVDGVPQAAAADGDDDEIFRPAVLYEIKPSMQHVRGWEWIERRAENMDVSSIGRVRRRKRPGCHGGIAYFPRPSFRDLLHNREPIKTSIARLVLSTFGGPPRCDRQADPSFLDGDRTNVRASNLAWICRESASAT